MSSVGAINPQELTQLIHLLELAQSSDNSKQAEVYATLKSIEEQPLSYIYLAYIFAQPDYHVALRQMAGLTLNSFLKRNKNVVHLEPAQMQQIKTALLQSTAASLNNVKSMVISQLINRENFDFELFAELINGIQHSRQNVGMINIILEDIKFNNQNYNIFEDHRFWRVMEMIYDRLLSILHATVLQAMHDTHLKTEIKCINLLTFHCPARLYHYLTKYLDTIIKPILIYSATHALPAQIIQLALEGVNQIVATKFSLIPREILDLIINYTSFTHSPQIQKCWSNIIIEIVQNDENNAFQAFLPTILPKAIEGVTFTPQDQRNIKEEMEVEYNPYNEDQEEEEEESIEEQEQKQTEIFEASYGSTSGYTLRKLSFQLIEKISIHYSENLWNQWSSYIGQRLKNPNPAVSQTGISFIGIIAETCMYDMEPHLQQLAAFLVEKASQRNCALIRATSLWTLEKLVPVLKDHDEIVSECLGLVFEGIQNSSEGTHTTHLMLKEASISLLDEILSLENVPKIMNLQLTQQIVNTLLQGLSIFKGRALFSIFKAFSSIFESEYLRSIISEPTCDRIVGELCKKWSSSLKSDSIMCPLLQCLITAYQGLQKYLSKFNIQFFSQLIPLLQIHDRKQLVLRCIDFLSSIINAGHINLNACVINPAFLDLVCKLVTSQEREIRHFTYILISDIGKKYDISAYVQRFVVVIGQTMDCKSLASRNNALMCLTDLLAHYYPIVSKYVGPIMGKVVDIINNEDSVFAFNFARMLGRICLLNAQQGKRQLDIHPNLVKFAFLSLRTREVNKLTSDSFRGMLLVLNLLSYQELLNVFNDLECVLQALVCYPVRREESAENETVLTFFAQFTRNLKQKLGEQLWTHILHRPIFLPAAIRTITAWTK